jgi:hypothetical protein
VVPGEQIVTLAHGWLMLSAQTPEPPKVTDSTFCPTVEGGDGEAVGELVAVVVVVVFVGFGVTVVVVPEAVPEPLKGGELAEPVDGVRPLPTPPVSLWHPVTIIAESVAASAKDIFGRDDFAGPVDIFDCP